MMDNQDRKYSKNSLSRRQLLKAGLKAGLAAGTVAGSSGAALATTKEGSAEIPFSINRLLKQAPLSKSGGQRVIVVGGGWSGLTMAKYLKINNPAFDVVLIDKRPVFISFPASNSWLADQVNLDFLTHSYFDAAREK